MAEKGYAPDQKWFNRDKVDYETPADIFDPLNKEFNFNLDVAASQHNAKVDEFFTQVEDGLVQKWEGVAWMNPPFGREMQKWVRKAYSEFLERGTTVVALLPARTNTKWWHECIQDIAIVRFIQGQVKFNGYKRGLWMPMCIVIWNFNINKALN